MNEAVKIRINDNVDAVFKPAHAKSTLPYTERAAYDVSKDIGLDNVPVTTVRTINGEFGSCQVWSYKGQTKADWIMNDPDALSKIYTKKLYQEQTARMQVFDVIINNIDRHAGNYLIDKQGALTFIDHGASFTKIQPLTDRQLMFYSDAVKGLTQADKLMFKQGLEKLSKNDYVEKLVKSGIPRSDAVDFVNRAKFLLEETKW